MIRVRVRGIYATALAKLFLDNDEFQLSDVSKRLSERLGGYQGVSEPPHVTVKTSDKSPHELIVNGFYEEGSKTFDLLHEFLTQSPRYIGRPNLHSAYKVTLNESCEVEIDGIKVKVESPECFEGKETIIEIVRSALRPGEHAIAEEGLRVQGFFAEVKWGGRPGVSFSRHISNPELKALLINLSADLTRLGYHVHWRSSAKQADLQVLREELERLRSEIEKILVKAREAPPGTMLYKGEFLGLFNVVLEDKMKFDEVRNKVLKTMPYHHTLKAGGDKFSTAAELGDKLSPFDWEKVRSCLMEFYPDATSSCREFLIHHEKLDGKVIRIGPARKLSFENGRLLLKRVVGEFGMYDGLNVKKEPNDVILTVVEPFKNYLIHGYFNEFGDLKGIYVNINSGVEIGECTVRYVDYEVDVVYNGIVRVIDMDELERFKDVLPSQTFETINETIREVKGRLESGELQRELKGLVPTP